MNEEKTKSQFHAICEAAAQLIRASAGVTSDIPVVAYERGDLMSEFDRRLAEVGLGVVILPFEPVHALDGSVPAFYDEADLIVQIIENPGANMTTLDGSCLRDQVAIALAGSTLDGLLAEELSEHRILRADDNELTIREMTWKTAAQLKE